MANYATLKAAIQQVIRTNGNEEITGALLQQTLLAMVNSLGGAFQFVGVAQSSTNPGTPDQNVFYIAGAGSYPNFNNTTVADGYMGVFKYNGSWTIETLQVGKNYDDEIEQLEQKVGKFPIPITESGKYITTNTGVGNAIGAVVTNASYSYMRFPVNPGDKVIVNGEGGLAPQLWAFIDANEIILAVSNRTIESGLILTAPANTAEIIINTKDTSVPSYYIKSNSVDYKLNEAIRNREVGFTESNALIKADGTTIVSSYYDTTDYVCVFEGDKFLYKGYTPANVTYAAVVGFDANKQNPTVLLTSSGFTQEKEFSIPSGISFIRVCGAKSTYANYSGRFLYHIDFLTLGKEEQAKFKEIDEELSDIQGNINYISQDVRNINDTIFYEEKEYNVLSSVGSSTYWSHEITKSGDYILKSTTVPTSVKLYEGNSATSTLVKEFSSSEIVPFGVDSYKIVITDANIQAGGKYLRFAGITISDTATDFFLLTIHTTLEALDVIKSKTVAVIGDSISSDSEMNPYLTVLASDVGNEIESYVTYWDIYKYENNIIVPTGKTIGGVTFTDAMVGTMQTFTPVLEDVGKKIGVAPTYYNWMDGWADKLCEKAGATLINASWSGASMCSGQLSQEYALSYAWSDYTISRCSKRDSDGNVVNPDVIIIYRGTNDLSHKQGIGTNLYSQLDSDYDLGANGYPVTDVYDTNKYGFYRAYYLTIKKLRDAYPGAIIYCCTLNVFKRITYDRFPTRNGQYTLPQMNDAIRQIANTMGCGIIEFDKDGITFENCYIEGYIDDSAEHPTHPSRKGHLVMANKAATDLNFVL